MTSIDQGLDVGEAPERPGVALRVVTTYDGTTRRFDIELRGATSVVVEDGEQTLFSTERVWPVLRDHLPPLDLLRAHPAARPNPEPATPGPTFVEDCRAHVSIATLVTGRGGGTELAVRTWLVTDDALWSVTPRADGTNRVQTEPEGALADLLVWDVTGAMETLVRALEPGAAAS